MAKPYFTIAKNINRKGRWEVARPEVMDWPTLREVVPLEALDRLMAGEEVEHLGLRLILCPANPFSAALGKLQNEGSA